MTPCRPTPDPYYKSIVPHKDIVLKKNLPPSKDQVQQIVKCFLHEVGKGSFGVVNKNLKPDYDSVFKVGKNSSESLKEFTREAEAYVKIAQKGGSNHLTHIINFFTYDHCPILHISSSVVSFNLRDYFKNSCCSQLIAPNLLSHTLEGLNYLHNSRITHGDIQPGNILAYMKGPEPDPLKYHHLHIGCLVQSSMGSLQLTPVNPPWHKQWVPCP